MSQFFGKQVVITLKRSIICTTPKHPYHNQNLFQSFPFLDSPKENW